MKIKAFNWDIEIQEYYVKINGETVATGYIPLGRSNEQIISSDKDADVFFDSVFNAPEPNQALKDASQNQATDCDGTPLRYFDNLICVKPFTDSEGIHWLVGETGWHSRQDGLIDEVEFTHSELKNFRKLN